MRIDLDHQDIEAIAQKVIDLIKPLIASNSKHEGEDNIFDVKGLAEYLKVSPKWIYERTALKEIPHIKADGQVRFRKSIIDKWLSGFNVPAVSSPAVIQKIITTKGGETSSNN